MNESLSGSDSPRPPGRSPGIRALNLVDGVIAGFEKLVLAYGILLMAANSVANVIGRTFLGSSLYFSEELNQFLIVLVTFVGLGYASRQGRHIRMSALYDQLDDRWRKVLMVFIAGVTAIIMFTLAWYSYQYVARVASLGKVTPALQLPLYLTYLWVPVGFVITGIQYSLTVLRNLREKDVYISYEHVDSYDETDYSLEHSEQAEETATGTSRG